MNEYRDSDEYMPGTKYGPKDLDTAALSDWTDTQHTPGPWTDGKLGNDADQYAVYAEGGGATIAVTHADEGGANARLIAAAPDLLEAAKKAAGFLDGYPSGLPAPEAEQLRAAITRAEGRE